MIEIEILVDKKKIYGCQECFKFFRKVIHIACFDVEDWYCFKCFKNKLKFYKRRGKRRGKTLDNFL